ncbi:MAG: glycosyltransferase [Actinomycetia bacterium]|nr:glycosyltransferase [Actinomycetes bacterium]
MIDKRARRSKRGTDPLPLKGIRVAVLLGIDNLACNNRVRKQAKALCEAGASVTVYNYTEQLIEEDPVLAAEPFQVVSVGDIKYTEAVPFPELAPYFEITNERWPRLLRIADHLFFNKVYNDRKSLEYQKACGVWHIEHEQFHHFYTEHCPYFMYMDLVEKPDVVHVHDLDALFAGAYIARREGAKLIYDSHEIYLEQGWSEEVAGWIAVLADIEQRDIHQSDALITVVPQITTHLLETYGYRGPTLEMYNSFNEVADAASPVSDPVRFVFSGMFDPQRNLIELVTAFDQLRGIATLSLQGFAGIKEELEALIERLDLQETVFFVDPVEPSEIVASFRDYDVGTLIWTPTSKNLEFSGPNKLFDYMGAGLALVASDDLIFITSVIEEYGNGYTFKFDSVDSIAAQLREICADPALISSKKKASLVAAQQFVWDRQAAAMIELYQQVLEHK